MTVYLVYSSFIILIIILFIISIYFLFSLSQKKFNENKIKEKEKEILGIFKTLINDNKENAIDEINILKKNFSNGRDIQAFHLAYVRYVKQYGQSQELLDLLNKVVDYKKIIKSKIVKKSYRKSYTLYLISEFKLSSEGAADMALKSLKDNSIYVRNNALHVIGNQGNIKNVMEALNQINKKEKYYNDKILIDFLDSFKGNIKKLDSEILARIDKYNINLKSIIIEHLINMENDNEAIRDKVLEFLENENNNEVLIKSTRYFSQVRDERARKYILKNMDSDNWTLRASSSNVISKYPGKEAIEKLKERLGDPNYFVRRNSANSFIKLQEKEQVFTEALYNKDPFARDILTYKIGVKAIEGFAEFKSLNGIEDEQRLRSDLKTDDKEELNIEWA